MVRGKDGWTNRKLREWRARKPRWHALLAAVRHFEGVHLTIGVLGDLCFLLGSIVLLSRFSRTLAISLYIAGASGMLVGNIGKGLVRVCERKLDHRPDLPSPT